MKRALYLLWLLPSLLLWASFPPRSETVNILFALAPLIFLSRQGRAGAPRTPLPAPAIWFLNGLIYYLATLSWMPAIVKNGGPWPLVALGLFALSAYCALYFAAYGYLLTILHRWVRKHSYWYRLLAIVIFEPVLWAGLELIRSRFGGGFAWNQLGVVAVNAGFGAPAALGGVYLLSMVIVLINGTIAGVAERVLRKGGTSLETLIPLALVLAVYQITNYELRITNDGQNFCSTASTASNDSTDSNNPKEPYSTLTNLSVALIQRNFPCVFNPRKAQDPVLVYSNLVQNVALLKPDLVVLPESAMSEFGRIDGPAAKWFAERLRAWTGASMGIAGGTRFEKEEKEFNSAALYTEESTLTYDKVHLVPFGEFIPGDKFIPALQKLAPVGSCTPGEPKLVGGDDRGAPLFGVAICYEDTDSALMREYAKKGARALIFITNDSWFSHSTEAEQHAWQAVARAIETGLPIVRVGNSGVSGTITPDGVPTWMTNSLGAPLIDRQGTMFDRISLGGGTLTPYVKYGDIPLFLTFIACFFAVIMIEYLDRRKETTFKEMEHGEN